MEYAVQEHFTIEKEPWYTLFKKANLINPQTGEPSMRALTKKTGIHVSALSAIFSGKTRYPRYNTLSKIAKALNMSVFDFSRHLGVIVPQEEDMWKPPIEAAYLTPYQRKMMESLIKMLAASNFPQNND